MGSEMKIIPLSEEVRNAKPVISKVFRYWRGRPSQCHKVLIRHE